MPLDTGGGWVHFGNSNADFKKSDPFSGMKIESGKASHWELQLLGVEGYFILLSSVLW